MNAYEVVLQGVEKSFETFHFGPFDLNIEPGVCTAFVGPNGSGKTTLFEMLLNICRPDQGKITLFGSEYEQHDVDIKRRIGYVPDRSFIEESSSRIEELADFHNHWFPAWSKDKWNELSERFELNPKAKANSLSKGMKRRLAFCLAIAQQPDLLILDEPSSGFDPYIWRIMLDVIREFMNSGEKNVLIATHTIEEVRRLADYVAFLYGGKLLDYKEKDAMLDEWKALWIESMDPDRLKLPGVVECEQGALTRFVTRNAALTEEALQAAGIPVIKRQSLELDEILHHMIAEKKHKEQAAKSRKGAENT
ncbi:ABC transporter ATP-binding protein [Paenibacillus allorhizosphaerae]|uniref:Multidrug efflux system ATP-binding protein n=1 Tax=Paenibacillus allorhizosphaerae TaxID=2849866 RepID=A0ABM8VFU3_9BACL|nr:ABC transporter ATP-binding protein [Paenibacillus allorhizosphaerae]CAG7636045.1 Multidrug efflux system ATP-binding protein [Paenibacillus allorhizosphaerae]